MRFPRVLVVVLLGACASLPIIGRATPERWAFTAPWDARSTASARAHGASLDALVVDFIPLDSVTGIPAAPYPDSLTPLLPASGRRMALVTSYTGDSFHPALIRRLAQDSSMLKRTASGIVSRMQRGGYRGMVIDFEGMTAADTALTRSVVATLATAARAGDVGPVIVCVPPTDTSGYPARIFASADLLLVMLYDEHWATSPPGAISSPQWVRRSLATRVAESGASRIVAGLPLYGYLWPAKGQPGRAISYAEAVRLAAEAGVALERDPATSTLRASRPGGDGWELWVTDAVLLDALSREVAALNVRRVAYWRLGMEDPSFW